MRRLIFALFLLSGIAHADQVIGDFDIGTNSGRAISIDSAQVFYKPTGFVSSDLFGGDGGTSLSHTTGLEGYYNTGFGMRCLSSITTGSYNSCFGFESLNYLTTGKYNSGFGEATLIYKTTANGNTSLGWKANLGIPLASGGTGTGDYNTCGGYGACINLDQGTGNTVYGAFAYGSATPTGSYNVLIGYNAGAGLTTGSGNVVLGNYGLAPTSTNTIIIADGVGHPRIVSDQYSVRLLNAAGNAYILQVTDNGVTYPTSYTVATLPGAGPGGMAYASNCRNPGEGAGAGKGCMVSVNSNSVWIAVWSGLAVTQ